MSNVIPNGFYEWKENMDTWGKHLFDTINTVSRLLAVGLDLEPEFFVDRMKNSDTLLAPTGINVAERKVNDIVAGYHYAISFLSIHGKSRYPGLYIWTHNGQKVLVKIPDGYLLIQAGKHLEHVTGGYIQAGPPRRWWRGRCGCAVPQQRLRRALHRPGASSVPRNAGLGLFT